MTLKLLICIIQIGGIQIDFKQADNNGNFKLNHYHQNYGYDLESSLAKHPIKELENPIYKQDLINSLKKGNLQSVTFKIDGTENKQFVEANPHFKTISVYNEDKQRIRISESKDQKQGESEGKSMAKDSKQKQDVEDPESDGKAKSKTRKNRQAHSM